MPKTSRFFLDNLKLRRLRAKLTLIANKIHLSQWFPHLPLALALFYGGFALLQSNFAGRWQEYWHRLLEQQQMLSPALLPPLLLGFGMLIMAGGLALRSRLAWVIAFLLVSVAIASVALEQASSPLLTQFIVLLALLSLFWRAFDRSSLAAGTLFALTAVILLLGYSTFGAYYLGAEFDSPIKDLNTAFYWSMVTMSTVGYGDISPVSSDAKLFAASVIVMGVAVFATALTSVIAPLVSRSLARIVQDKRGKMKRENHFIVIGNTALASSTALALQKRGQAVTRILCDKQELQGELDGDVIFGEPSNKEILTLAGVEKAEAVLSMLADDADNAFVVLAVRSLGSQAETLVAVENRENLEKIKLVRPDVVLTPQLLGSELTAMLLSGEMASADFVMQNIFQRLNERSV